MKSNPDRRDAAFAAGCGLMLFFLVNSAAGQTTTRPTDSNYDPLGNSNSSLVPRAENDNPSSSPTRSETPVSSDREFEGGRRGKYNYGKREEVMVTTGTSKPAEIKKTKFGSADTSEGHGVFKGSLLDSDIKLVPASSPAAAAEATPAQGAAEAKPSIAPKPSPRLEAPASPELDIKTGVSPAPSGSPIAKP